MSKALKKMFCFVLFCNRIIEKICICGLYLSSLNCLCLFSEGMERTMELGDWGTDGLNLAAGTTQGIPPDLRLNRKTLLSHLSSLCNKVCVYLQPKRSVNDQIHQKKNIQSVQKLYLFSILDDRPPYPASAPPPLPLSSPLATLPKRPDKSTKPKLPPRPLSTVFICKEHKADVLQVFWLRIN